MKLHRGTHRYVLVAGPLVIKVARLPLWVIKVVLSGEYSIVADRVFLRRQLFGGLMENIREGICYLLTRHKLLTPTLSFVFFNLQPRVSGVGVLGEGEDLWREIVPKVYEDDGDGGYDGVYTLFSRCSHTFQSDNFAFDGVSVRFVDYGENGIRKLLIQYGGRLEEHLLLAAEALVK